MSPQQQGGAIVMEQDLFRQDIMIFLERSACPSPPNIMDDDDDSLSTQRTFPTTISPSSSLSFSWSVRQSQPWQSAFTTPTTELYRPLALRPLELASCMVVEDDDDNDEYRRYGAEKQDERDDDGSRMEFVTDRPCNPSPCSSVDEEDEPVDDNYDSLYGPESNRFSSRYLLQEMMEQQQQQQLSRAMSLSPVTEDEDDDDFDKSSNSSSTHATSVYDDDESVLVGKYGHMMVSSGETISTEAHVIVEDDDDHSSHCVRCELETARDGLLSALSLPNMDPKENTQFLKHLQVLRTHFETQLSDTNHHSLQGTWLTLSKPIFRECLGTNDAGDPLYTLSRMSFDLFAPANLVCSLQGTFNTVRDILPSQRNIIPKELQGYANLQTYDCLAAFTMEAGTSFGEKEEHVANKSLLVPVRGIFQTSGFVAPDPHIPNRHLVWYVSATMRANDTPKDKFQWQRLFASSVSSWMRPKVTNSIRGTRHVHETSQSFVFAAPMTSYIDTLYQDDSLRVGRGNHGSYYVLTKLSNA